MNGPRLIRNLFFTQKDKLWLSQVTENKTEGLCRRSLIAFWSKCLIHDSRSLYCKISLLYVLLGGDITLLFFPYLECSLYLPQLENTWKPSFHFTSLVKSFLAPTSSPDFSVFLQLCMHVPIYSIKLCDIIESSLSNGLKLCKIRSWFIYL